MMKRPMDKTRRRLLLLAAAGLGACHLSAATPTLTGTDLGSPQFPGSVTTAADKITVVGGGADIWGTADAGYYAHFEVTGDFDYVVKVESLVGNTGDGGWAKAELMARQVEDWGPGIGLTVDAGDPHISNMTTRPSSDTPAGGTAGVNYRGPQWRAVRAANSTWTTPNPVITPNMPNNWVRLERVGSVFYMYWSNDGTTWQMYNPYYPQGWDTAGSWPPGTDNPDVAFFSEAWPAKILLGLAVTAHADAYTSTAVFSSFGPWTPVPIAITAQPAAAVSISANSKLELSVGATGDPVHYQWRLNGNPIPRAVGPTYTVDLAQTTDSGTYTVRVFAAGQEIISSASVVSVTVDTTPPTLVEAKPLASQTTVQVTFSEPVTAATAEVEANYALTPAVAVNSAVLSADGFSVVLTTASQALNTLYTLKVNNVKDTAGNTIATDSTTTFTSVSLLKGYAFYERWNDADGDMGDLNAFATAIADGTARPADVTAVVNQFGGPWGATDNYNARVRTYFTPPANGNYVFFVSADDNARVYLSTDDNPANKKLICQEAGWSNQYQWTAPGSGAAEDKRSDQFATTEWADYWTITLQANRTYFMEVLWNEGGGGDGADVTFIREGDADPANNTDGMFMRGDAISWYETVDVLPPVIDTQPVDSLTIEAGGSATLSVVAHNPGAAALTYQWQKNGVDIPGATSADYTISNADPEDIGQYWVRVSNPKTSVLSGQGTPNPTVVLVKATGVFNIEAEDFDHDGGQTEAEASTMPYTGAAYDGLSASFDVDYHNTGATTVADGWTPIYRTGEPITSGTSAEMGANDGGQWGRTRAGEWDMTVNYKIGWIATGDWGNYTRTFPTPAKEYYVFSASSYDGVAAGQVNGALGFVTAGVGTTTQTVEAIGTFNAPGTGDWSRNNLVAMTDSAGSIKTVEIGGTKTVRWTYNSGDADYLLFIPKTGGADQPRITSIVKNANGSITITWEGGGSLEAAESLTGPWQTVTDTSPYTVTPTQQILFGRIKK